jgi:hypothetical protein
VWLAQGSGDQLASSIDPATAILFHLRARTAGMFEMLADG